MAPKIRGVAPPVKRYKADLGVERPQKTSKGQQKEPDLIAQTLRKGDIVEVRLEEQGLYGSWHQAVICGVKPGLRQVEFKNLLHSKDKHVKEWVLVGNTVAGTKQLSGVRRETDGKPILRPGGPGLPPAEPSFRKTGGWPKDLWVEVHSEEAWWEGVLVEGISASQMDEEDSVVDVIFPRLEDLIEQVAVKNLRECKDWNEETGLWTIRGRLGKENDPMRAALPPGSPVCEGNGREASKLDEDSILRRIESDGMAGTGEGTGEEGLKEAVEDHNSPATKPIADGQADSSVKRYFGQLCEVESSLSERSFFVRIDALHYPLEDIQITVKEGFISLDVTSESTESNVDSFISKVHNVCCALLEIPADANADHRKVRWELQDETLTFTIPWADDDDDDDGDEGRKGNESVSISSS